MELRNLAPSQQQVVALWLDLVAPGESLPQEKSFFGPHFSYQLRDFIVDSPFAPHKQNLLVLCRDDEQDDIDWRYLFKGNDIRSKIREDERPKIVQKVSEIERDSERKLIYDDLEILSQIQAPYHPRLLWRPYTGYFGQNREYKTFLRIGMPLINDQNNIASAIFMVMEANYDGRAVIDLA
jgi:hypothetical protein